MKKLVTMLAALPLATAVYAGEVQGILLDKQCAAKIAKANDQTAAKKHTRECALTVECVKAGYGVLTADGKFISIDPAGNTKVVESLKTTKKNDNLEVRVTGDVKGDTVKLTSIKVL
jgi:hypothetical protein